MDLEAIVLGYGEHPNPESGHCLLEVVSMFAGESFSDSPACVDSVLAAFGRAWNDGMRSDAERQQLKQYITRLPGTAKSSALAQKRGWMALDWLIRVHTGAWLALTPALTHHANALKTHAPITCADDLRTAKPLLDAARAAAGAAAGAAARAAAGAAAEVAAWSAARAAAGAAAGAAARAAAWSAAGAAAWDALEPTVKTLQESAHELFSAMIDAEIGDD